MLPFTRSSLSAASRANIDMRVTAARAEHPSVWQFVIADERVAATLPFVFACSEFVAATCLRDVELLRRLIESGDLFAPIEAQTMPQQLAAASNVDETETMRTLRRFRQYHMVRIAWRDLAGWAELAETLHELSTLADVCIQFAHEHTYRELMRRHGVPRGAQTGEPQSLVILGMGKLGGRELNYSSDIDLVFLYPEEGETDGERVLESAEFFLRQGQRIIHLLADKTVDGFVYRVDMRLRPFGDSGRMAISFDSFENYLQEHGRDWERYAYVKARPITAVAQHETLYRNVIRPFVYRRYLDFGVFESLRNMKELIAREVTRRELQDNVKLGPGGIREIEFIVQAFQLIRGGSDPRLQSRELRTALPLLAGQKLLPQAAVDELGAAYRFLRRLENRLQEYNDEQTHRLPNNEEDRDRLAWSMGMAGWPQLQAEIEQHRAAVTQHFADIVFGPADGSRVKATIEFELDMPIDELANRIASLGVAKAASCAEQLKVLCDSGYYRRLDETGHRRLAVLLPRTFKLLAGQDDADIALSRLLRIVEMIGGRTVYLALLGEHDLALRRLVELCSRSQFLAEQIAAFPLLLDELIDERLFEAVPTRAQFATELTARVAAMHGEDLERQIETLRQFQRIAMFRIAVADFSGRLPLMKISDRLTDLAELLVNETLSMAWAQIVERHGKPRCGSDAATLRDAQVVIVAYGKLGGIELGYGSDLDLVFLHDSNGEIQQTDSAQPIDNTLFFARLGQRLVHLLTTHTRAGRLYEIDIRLRPSGKGGLLVQSIAHFDEYQRKEAWTWEHQALLRARAIAGDSALCAKFEQVRIDVLRHAVRRDTLRDEVRKMRERMRAELSKAKPNRSINAPEHLSISDASGGLPINVPDKIGISYIPVGLPINVPDKIGIPHIPVGQFDLKQDAGGIADLEFLVQYWMLKWADEYPPIITFSDNIRQLESLASGDIVDQRTVDFLTGTYRKYRERMHHLSLAGGDDVIDASEFLEERQGIIRLWTEVMTDAHAVHR